MIGASAGFFPCFCAIHEKLNSNLFKCLLLIKEKADGGSYNYLHGVINSV